MGILSDIQNDLVSESAAIGPTLMKLRLLAAKLGSEDLEDWFKYESEGYPEDVDLPDYRVLGMSISGSFSGPFGSGIKNAPIPPFLIEKLVGKNWSMMMMRDSAAAIDATVAAGDGITLDLSNIILAIQGKVYENYACNQVVGFISHNSIVELSNKIRNKILSFTIEFEKCNPSAANLELSRLNRDPKLASQVFHQTIHGNLTNIQNSAETVEFNINILQGDSNGLRHTLSQNGISDEDSESLACAIESSCPNRTKDDALGNKARKWLGERISSGIDTGIEGGVSALTKIAQEAALQYWGLK